MSDNNVSIYGNASGVQIQQGNYNSTQTQDNSNLSDADVEKFQRILNQINKCRFLFEEEYGEKTDELIVALDQAQDALIKKDESQWKKAVSFIRDLTVEVGGGIISASIIGILPPM